MSKKIQICYSIKGVERFLDRHKNSKFILYLAHKDKKEWEKSTSRVYMNQISPRLIYLPVDIKKDDFKSLDRIYEIARDNDQVVAINQTQPHKNNNVAKELFRNLENAPINIDTIIKNKKGKLMPYNLNGPTFIDWFLDKTGTFTKKVVILIGAGGAGEPIAREIAKHKPIKLLLVDIKNKDYLTKELSSIGTVVEYSSRVKNSLITDGAPLVVINATGKEAIENDDRISTLLSSHKNKKHIFVDLRPQLRLSIVEKAKRLGWKAYTGYGMNVRNDYVFLCKVAKVLNVQPPSFISFGKLVAKAS